MDYELKLLFEVLLEKSKKLRLEADESLQDLYETLEKVGIDLDADMESNKDESLQDLYEALEKVDIDLDVDMESNKEVQLKTAIRDYVEKGTYGSEELLREIERNKGYTNEDLSRQVTLNPPFSL